MTASRRSTAIKTPSHVYSLTTLVSLAAPSTARCGSGTCTISAVSRSLTGRRLKVTPGSSGNHATFTLIITALRVSGSVA